MPDIKDLFSGLRITDLLMIGTIIFGGGTVYQQVAELQLTVDRLSRTVTDLQAIRQTESAGSTDRLARIEERLIGLQAQVSEIKAEVKRR
jgi:hypothetical protein